MSLEPDIVPGLVLTKHNGGFFSCCSYRLAAIVSHINKFKKCPTFVDSSMQFFLYKFFNTDVTFHYFQHYNNGKDITHTKDIKYHEFENCFENFKDLDFESLNPIIDKYFTPTCIIQDKIEYMIRKYDIDVQNTCALYHRGTDKAPETKLCPF